MECKECGKINPPEALFCIQCGTKLARGCPRCGAVYPEEALFCMKCGARLAEDELQILEKLGQKDSAVPRLEDIHSHLQTSAPKSLSEELESITPNVEGENRILSILYGDISGSVGLMENMHPDDAAQLINQCLEVMVDIVRKYEGNIYFCGFGDARRCH